MGEEGKRGEAHREPEETEETEEPLILPLRCATINTVSLPHQAAPGHHHRDNGPSATMGQAFRPLVVRKGAEPARNTEPVGRPRYGVPRRSH